MIRTIALLALFANSCGSPEASNMSIYSVHDAFPIEPDDGLTPGRLCKRPDEHRYPERIPYCRRDVSTNEKWDIIHDYDRELGYQVEREGRSNFKIDHFFPLCAGGSNHKTNLWPQHRSVYTITDQVEHRVCELLKVGRVTQKVAIETVKRAKFNLDEVDAIMEELDDAFMQP